MKAAAFERYGGPEVLHVREVPTPEPGPDELRVRVAAAGLNAFDWHQYRGLPYLVRTREGWSVREAERWLAPVLNYDPLAYAREAAE